MSAARHEWANRLPERNERSGAITIGLLNNMSDGALEATERQFVNLLTAAGTDLRIEVSFYHFPEVPRSDAAKHYMEGRYHTIESLWETKLDGLIVTGREPLFPSLRDEPYWNSFGRVHEWARTNTLSTVWSCLAAHAAVLHMDGIQRQRSEQKRCGVFDCVRVSQHPMLRHLPRTLRLPHSRWNGLPEADLIRNGYQVLTRAEDADVDCFIKQDSSLFVYFQGHPEYDSDTLLREYRRDINRFLNGEAASYPSMPRGYFDAGTERVLLELQAKGDIASHREALGFIESVAPFIAKEKSWGSSALMLYTNWLTEIHAKKSALAQTMNAASDRGSFVPEPLRGLQAEAFEAGL
ncbi:homoserine O-succinyltransferase MetA [Occallatibacter riparius]|uniref:Homoserine O-succinyltransferase n=1 Tax=Occallatibacter riparius TaxID=1002689 RepID=A0A9J7BMI6_9BACT|nr:homoserine O-succinyltransferase [Occallatibacter riparius]UWZ83705.1 homoserine O-succinyltransferase [Occallatibacter riparius]